jgi:hypothetical protein
LEAAYDQALAAAAAATPGTPESDRADAQVASIGNQLFPIREQLDSLNALVIDPGEVITAPVLPEGSEGLPAAVYIAAGALVGLLLGAVLAVVAEQRLGRIRNAQDLRTVVRVPAWLLEPPRAQVDPADPVLDAVVARLPEEWHTLVVTDLGSAGSAGVAERLAAVLNAYQVPVTTVSAHDLAKRSSATRRVAAVGDAAGPEAAAAMSRSDGVVMVVERGARQADVVAASHAVDDSGRPLIAAVLIGAASVLAPSSDGARPDPAALDGGATDPDTGERDPMDTSPVDAELAAEPTVTGRRRR